MATPNEKKELTQFLKKLYEESIAEVRKSQKGLKKAMAADLIGSMLISIYAKLDLGSNSEGKVLFPGEVSKISPVIPNDLETDNEADDITSSTGLAQNSQIPQTVNLEILDIDEESNEYARKRDIALINSDLLEIKKAIKEISKFQKKNNNFQGKVRNQFSNNRPNPNNFQGNFRQGNSGVHSNRGENRNGGNKGRNNNYPRPQAYNPLFAQYQPYAPFHHQSQPDFQIHPMLNPLLHPLSRQQTQYQYAHFQAQPQAQVYQQR